MPDATNGSPSSLSATRLAAVRRHLAATNADPARTTPVDAILITQAENRRYATGFTGSAGLVMISATDAAIFTDFRYIEQAGAQSPAYEVVRIEGSAWDAIATRAAAHGVRTLLVEARVKPKDIAFLRPGQDALVKLTAYDFSIYGGFPAKLDYISADSVLDEKKQESYYLVRVRTTGDGPKRDGKPLPIMPGMTATVHIQTGEKTFLQYLLKPVKIGRAHV